MKVQVANKQAWLEKVNKALDRITAKRKQDDTTYEAAWAAKYDNRGAFYRLIFGPMDRNPPANVHSSYSGFYPSIYAWGDYSILKQMKRVLESNDTGTIYFNEKEERVAR